MKLKKYFLFLIILALLHGNLYFYLFERESEIEKEVIKEAVILEIETDSLFLLPKGLKK